MLGLGLNLFLVILLEWPFAISLKLGHPMASGAGEVVDSDAGTGMYLDDASHDDPHWWRDQLQLDKLSHAVSQEGSSWRVALFTNRTDKHVRKMHRAESASIVCQGDLPIERGRLIMKYFVGTVCFFGTGYESRAASVVRMFQEAVSLVLMREDKIPPFEPKTIDINDGTLCDVDFAFSVPLFYSRCRTRLIPDFTFWKWPEAGLLPDYKTLTDKLQVIGKDPAQKQRCGWAGNVECNGARKAILRVAKGMEAVELVTPEAFKGTGGGRISMETQVSQWACLIDLPASGYSGRVPMLLHSGRPMIAVERSRGKYVDRTWYGNMLEAGVHYIPVHRNFSNLEEAVQKALSPEGNEIAANAQRLAAEHLTTEAAIEGIANILMSINSAAESP